MSRPRTFPLEPAVSLYRAGATLRHIAQFLRADRSTVGRAVDAALSLAEQRTIRAARVARRRAVAQ
jgi:hypothetical protein